MANIWFLHSLGSDCHSLEFFVGRCSPAVSETPPQGSTPGSSATNVTYLSQEPEIDRAAVWHLALAQGRPRPVQGRAGHQIHAGHGCDDRDPTRIRIPRPQRQECSRGNHRADQIAGRGCVSIEDRPGSADHRDSFEHRHRHASSARRCAGKPPGPRSGKSRAVQQPARRRRRGRSHQTAVAGGRPHNQQHNREPHRMRMRSRQSTAARVRTASHLFRSSLAGNPGIPAATRLSRPRARSTRARTRSAGPRRPSCAARLPGGGRNARSRQSSSQRERRTSPTCFSVNGSVHVSGKPRSAAGSSTRRLSASQLSIRRW